MPSVFSGALVFGLVSVPITVVGATEEHSVRFRRIHTVDGGLVRNRYWCEVEDREVSYGEIGKGYELPGGRVIPVTDEELRALPLPTARAIELIAFIPAPAVDPLRIGTGYYLQPQGAIALKPYVLLRMALERASRVAVVRFAWHGRERVGLLRVRGGVIALHGLLWPDEVRDPAAVVPPPVQLEDEEIDEALALVEAMTRDSLEGPQFADHYTDALHEVIEAKRDARQLPEVAEPAARPGQLVDLMAALQQSVDEARAARGETGDAEAHQAPTAPAKKATAGESARKAPAQTASSRNAGRNGGRRGAPAR
ncbi:Ku protein [Streptomyces sp. FXJ1.172]|uniref:non-homologous end joining protein Ku n=1 Tax=Streptomyces sp. FXJ1.172 TaxID=710705 RepID=UPI0007CF512F|nr:Ku protein [Streptomyces sp. FXJ1.172]WEO92692.1 Ku protein [Streptomyces sp. FXJ1.172]